ncbi:MAG: hypothetical protein ACQESG_06015 [Nanobdellota archaeon]
MKAKNLIVMAFLLVVALGCQDARDTQEVPSQEMPVDGMTEQDTEQSAPQQDSSAEEITGSVVATVNGKEILQEEVQQTQQMFMQQGQQVSEEQVLNQLIDQMLLAEQAQEYMPSTEETEQTIEAQLQQQGMTIDDYKQQVEAQGIAYEDQLEQLKQDLAIQNYLQKQLEDYEYNISSEEAKEYYEEYKTTQNGSVPPFEELESQIMAVLEQEKQQEAQQEIIEGLREKAEITKE